MPECRGCGVALDWHEGALGLCRDCWDATESDADPYMPLCSLCGEHHYGGRCG